MFDLVTSIDILKASLCVGEAVALVNLGKYLIPIDIKERITNKFYDKFNISDYPKLNKVIDVKQLEVSDVYNGKVLYKYKLKLKRNTGITINNLEEYREVIENEVGRVIEFEIIDYKNVYVKVLYTEKKNVLDSNIETDNVIKFDYMPTVKFEKNINLDKVKFTFTEGEKKGVSAFVGYDMNENLKVFDILEGHTMVGGASRWGKSSFLNVFITSIMLTFTPNEVMFLGCDYKMSDVYYFRKFKHFRGMSTNKKEFVSQINALEEEMKLRAEILDKTNCRNVINYNEKYDKKISYIIFVIDELVQVATDKECSAKLHALMSKCASYGIYVILASQDFTKDTIGKCKMNCSQVVGFHTLDETDSTTLIGKGYDLQDINIKGRCKIRNSEGVDETQIFYLDEDKIEELLKPYLKQ